MLPDELRSIFRRATRKSISPLPIGRDGRIRVNYFLDLMTASHDTSSLTVLATHFSDWMKTRTGLRDYQAIVTPKRGNVLLLRQVAELLGKNSGFVKENVLFGEWVEGLVKSGDSVLLIDDVASDGELLLDAANSLKRSGIFVERVLVLVDRTEGDASGFLSELSLGYEFYLQLSDADLAKL